MSSAPFSRRIEPVAISREQETIRLVAGAEERERIAAELELLDLSRLEAELTLNRKGGGRVEISGMLMADLAQPCVVTLERVDQSIETGIARSFVPEGTVPKRGGDDVVDVSVDADDPPDTYDRGGIDVGAFVYEELVLAIDPFPRAPGATLPDEARDEGDAAADSPFAVLKSIGNSNGS